MKNRRVLGAVLAIVVLVLSTGCATSPTARYAQARDALTTTEEAILDLHAVGLVSDRELVEEVHPVALVIRDALDRAREALPDGPGLDDYLSVAEAALLRLAEIRADAERGDE